MNFKIESFNVQACLAMGKKKFCDAHKHLHNADEIYDALQGEEGEKVEKVEKKAKKTSE